MGASEDAVDCQVRACNEREVEEFVACYAKGVVVERADGAVVMSGRQAMRERYGRPPLRERPEACTLNVGDGKIWIRETERSEWRGAARGGPTRLLYLYSS